MHGSITLSHGRSITWRIAQDRSTGKQMRLRVRELGDEVHVEVDGVAGRQQRVLAALNECQRLAGGSAATPVPPGDVAIRSGADRMRIRLKGRDGLNFEAEAIYRCLREALVERRSVAESGVPAR
jgi:hypothetical protein